MSSQRNTKQTKRKVSSDHRSSAITDLLLSHALKNPPPPPRPLTEEELSVLAYGEDQYKKRKDYIATEKAKRLLTEEGEVFLAREAYRLFPNPTGTLPRGFDYRWLCW